MHLQQYKRLIERAWLPYIRPHDLRHTAATLLLLEGVQPLVMSEMLGHASVAFMLATYGHVQAEMQTRPRRNGASFWWCLSKWWSSSPMKRIVSPIMPMNSVVAPPRIELG
ncbi:MAG: tyrosine-type recombinase/integrase [Ktedonobacterales bacterium]